MLAAVVTPWRPKVDDTPEGGNWPQLAIDFPGITASDVTHQQADSLGRVAPEPNEYTVLVEAREATIKMLETNPNYTVLWAELTDDDRSRPRPPPPERPDVGDRRTKPGPAEKAAEIAKLLAKGVSREKARELVGDSEDLTRAQIAARRIAWQRDLPKATR